ncbi:PASTA domain-containing protein [Longispora sp. K20-0274]|uniref:PASTA domain-containing protein n=1 Tax=Longispora sp. K20-0274 TaxID=3088255 RepID=UPI003999F440
MATIPAVYGLSTDDARALLAQAGFTVESVSYEYSSEVAAGVAIGTDPAEGWSFPGDASVALIASKGPNPVNGYVPEVPTDSYDQAAAVLAAAGYLPGYVEQESATVAAGLVIAIRPAAGTPLNPGGTVDVFVSVGVPYIPPEPTGPATPRFE